MWELYNKLVILSHSIDKLTKIFNFDPDDREAVLEAMKEDGIIDENFGPSNKVFL